LLKIASISAKSLTPKPHKNYICLPVFAIVRNKTKSMVMPDDKRV